jgi:hypothetical protein
MLLSEFLQFSLAIVILPLLHIRLSPHPDMCNNLYQAAHYHILVFIIFFLLLLVG